MSKLAALAKSRRKAADLGDNDNKSVGIINRLTGGPQASFSGSKTVNTRPIRAINKKPVIIHDHELDTVVNTSIAPETPSVESKPLNLHITAIEIDQSLLIPLKYLTQSPKRHKPNPLPLITNKPLLETAHTNFSTPSPDERIQQAQTQAFAQGFQELSVTPKPKAVRPESTSESTSESKSKSTPKSTPKPESKNANINAIKRQVASRKPHKSFVVIGHVDAGKSTLMGRILLDSGTVDLKTVNKLIKESESIGKGSFALAWIMDQTSEERSRGVTIDIVSTNFDTKTTQFTAIDAPGHKDFVPQMINGVCQADFALLIVDGITGEFELGFSSDGQTKEHILIAKNLGIGHVCVVINKLDKENWSELRYDFIKSTMTDYLTAEIGFSTSQIDFVPVSGLTGNNVVVNAHPLGFEWYKGQTLVQYCESVNLNAPDIDDIVSQPLTMIIHDIDDISSSQFKVTAKVGSGYVQVNDRVTFAPIQETAVVSKLSSAKFAVAGDIIDATFSKNQFKDQSFDQIIAGDIITTSPWIKSVANFQCKLTMFNLTKPLMVGTPFILFRNNLYMGAKISNIESIEGLKKKRHLVSKQVAVVEIEIEGNRLLPLCIYDKHPELGKVVLRKEGITIGAGIVTMV